MPEAKQIWFGNQREDPFFWLESYHGLRALFQYKQIHTWLLNDLWPTLAVTSNHLKCSRFRRQAQYFFFSENVLDFYDQ